jgi:hypothetical protein
MELALKEYKRSATRLILLGMLGAFMALGVIAALPAEKQAGHCELRAVTSTGDLYILGAGDSCQDAFTNHAPIPSDYSRVWYEHFQR